MDSGVTGKLGEYYLTQQYQKNRAAGKSDSVSFAEFAAAKAAGAESVEGMSFKDMWQARFPGAYYHVMDGSKISQGAWDRNDFPFERFFSDNVQSCFCCSIVCRALSWSYLKKSSCAINSSSISYPDIFRLLIALPLLLKIFVSQYAFLNLIIHRKLVPDQRPV